MADDTAHLLIESGKISGDVFKCHDRKVVRIADADMAARLIGGVNVKASGHELSLVGDDADDASADSRKAGDDVFTLRTWA